MYSIKQVSTMLDMPTVTIRAWENRYGAVNPLRTESGYRMYCPEDIEDLRWLKEQVEQKGISISQAARLLKADKAAQSKAGSFPVLAPMGADEAFDQLSGQIYEALFEFQGERANKLIDYGFSIYGYDAMFYKILVPVLVRAGDAWQHGQASVAQEHFITELVSRRFLQFFHLFPIHSYLPKALSFCPDGEYHQVGLMLFSLLLRRSGLDVFYLGPNTPLDGLLHIIGAHRIGIVCISITDPDFVPKVDEFIRLTSSHYPSVRFLLGGPGFEGENTTAYPNSVLSEPPEKWQEWINRFIGRVV
ncbi:Predicted transcriptional regulators [Paenibacillus uliginis N3/975]|uniref:Predicted transcriptional regulators n=1 Tax=Paenibacillus uliginis N3/975 TaxID=1313296 RepID=A0A1X7GAD8_9BACL|nr:MerR family transcriptional regulator [Paenibacillus uliginis]SMF66667.1 Predicted transcriptional regulators [Paenibacillus uliginis N3/975]